MQYQMASSDYLGTTQTHSYSNLENLKYLKARRLNRSSWSSNHTGANAHAVLVLGPGYPLFLLQKRMKGWMRHWTPYWLTPIPEQQESWARKKAPLPVGHSPGSNVGNEVMDTTVYVQCCVCGKDVLNNDVKVVCNSPQCSLVVHATCAGYSLHGASWAKYLCAAHKVSKASAVRTEPKAGQTQVDGSLRAGTQVACSQTSPQTDSSTSSTQQSHESLFEAYSALEAAFNNQRAACKQECRELKLYNLKLEEQILSLEKEVSTLKNKLSHASHFRYLSNAAPKGPRPAGATLAKSSYAQALSGESNRARATTAGKFSHMRVFYKTDPTNGSALPQIALRIIRGSRSQGCSTAQRRDHEHTQPTPSANFIIVWGTKLATKMSQMQEAIMTLLPSTDQGQKIRQAPLTR